jgi:hypothetical protein
LRAARDAAPADPSIASNLGVALRELGRFDEALACFDDVLAEHPDHADAHVNAASVLLMRGDYRRGWDELEWRDRLAGATRSEFGVPRWQGEALAGRTLLVHAEMGLGDTIQFCRYLRLIQDGRVIVLAPAALARLLGTALGVHRVVARGEALPPIDLHCPMLSLPRLFATTADAIPAEIPYLHPDLAAVAAWRGRLAALPGRPVGVCWSVPGVVADGPEAAALADHRMAAR